MITLPSKNVVSHQCEYGLTTVGPDGLPVLAKKPTRWASNSHWLIQRLSRRCSGKRVHQPLLGGRARDAEHYPIDLIVEILRGIRDTADQCSHVYDEDDAIVAAVQNVNVGLDASQQGGPPFSAE